MNFDEQLKRVVDGAVGQISALAADLQTRARQEGLDEGRREGRAEADERGRAAIAAAEAAAAEARAEASRTREALKKEALEKEALEKQALEKEAREKDAQAKDDTTARLIVAMRALDGAASLTEILQAILDATVQEAAQAAVLVGRNERFVPWRSRGFEGGSAAALEVGAGDDSVVADAIRTKSASGDADSFAMPIVIAGDVVAVIHAAAGRGTGWHRRVEILTRHAARCLEALTAIKAARSLATRPQHEAPSLN